MTWKIIEGVFWSLAVAVCILSVIRMLHGAAVSANMVTIVVSILFGVGIVYVKKLSR